MAPCMLCRPLYKHIAVFFHIKRIGVELHLNMRFNSNHSIGPISLLVGGWTTHLKKYARQNVNLTQGSGWK